MTSAKIIVHFWLPTEDVKYLELASQRLTDGNFSQLCRDALRDFVERNPRFEEKDNRTPAEGKSPQ